MAKQPVIGILGGGQLGLMTCQSAHPLGIQVAVLDEENCPANQINHNSLNVAGSFKDAEKIVELARKCDVLTVEIEHVDTTMLEEIEANGVEVQDASGATTTKKVEVHPSSRTLKLIQDKYLQKAHFQSQGIPVAEQMEIASGEVMSDSLEEAASKFGLPFVLKSRKNSYDGRGNFVIKSKADFASAIEQMGKLSLYAEKMVPFEKELAVMVIRTESNGVNAVYSYPPVETVHEDSICTTVYMPPRGTPSSVGQKARQVAESVIQTLWGRGVFAVELFLLKDGT
jgi:phosphoribosylaminoimidazole carboxylase